MSENTKGTFIPLDQNDTSSDSIRIKGKAVHFELTVITGKQGDFFIALAPTINITGYGKTEKEALEFLDVEGNLFSEDLMSMKPQERNNFLLALGFKKEKYHSKNFSKSYIDENGLLQNFEPGTVKKQMLQVA